MLIAIWMLMLNWRPGAFLQISNLDHISISPNLLANRDIPHISGLKRKYGNRDQELSELPDPREGHRQR